jgi:hypothetical protein
MREEVHGSKGVKLTVGEPNLLLTVGEPNLDSQNSILNHLLVKLSY